MGYLGEVSVLSGLAVGLGLSFSRLHFFDVQVIFAG